MTILRIFSKVWLTPVENVSFVRSAVLSTVTCSLMRSDQRLVWASKGALATTFFAGTTYKASAFFSGGGAITSLQSAFCTSVNLVCRSNN